MRSLLQRMWSPPRHPSHSEGDHQGIQVYQPVLQQARWLRRQPQTSNAFSTYLQEYSCQKGKDCWSKTFPKRKLSTVFQGNYSLFVPSFGRPKRETKKGRPRFRCRGKGRSLKLNYELISIMLLLYLFFVRGNINIIHIIILYFRYLFIVVHYN